ncbi:MAG: UxaA family hydrolase [Synergistaceae bacterium]|nr:UxaA family hydrolase [Synergistaceae bacterium]
MKFRGYIRENGSVGIRNYILVLSSVVCANHVCAKIAEQAQNENIVAFCHNNGCGQIGIDKEQTLRTLIGIGKNPNISAVLVIGLGCEGVSVKEIAAAISDTGKPVEFLLIQECGGTSATIEAGSKIINRLEERRRKQVREEADLDKLVVALECGGSDATSGITANPVVGEVSDRVVKEGGTVILSETTEMIGAEHILSSRAFCAGVADSINIIVQNIEQSAKAMQVDLRGTQPTPGNIAGGLSTIEEKSLGCLAKAGKSGISAVIKYGESPQCKGLVIMDTPGFDVESVTGMLAGGAQIVLFTTGRGTPVGSPVAPVIKITGNSQVAAKMKENIDFDVSAILEGKATILSASEQLFSNMLNVIEGEKTSSEILGHREASITRIGPSV